MKPNLAKDIKSLGIQIRTRWGVRLPGQILEILFRTRKFRNALIKSSEVLKGVHLKVFTPLNVLPLARLLPGIWLVYYSDPDSGARFLGTSYEWMGTLAGLTNNFRRFSQNPGVYLDLMSTVGIRDHADRNRNWLPLTPGGVSPIRGGGEAELLKPLWFLLPFLDDDPEECAAHVFKSFGRRGGWHAQVRKLFREPKHLREAQRWNRLASWLLRHRLDREALLALDNLRAVQYVGWGSTGSIRPGSKVSRWFHETLQTQRGLAERLGRNANVRALDSMMDSLKKWKPEVHASGWSIPRRMDWLEMVRATKGHVDASTLSRNSRQPTSS